jgi:hypothetical protein
MQSSHTPNRTPAALQHGATRCKRCNSATFPCADSLREYHAGRSCRSMSAACTRDDDNRTAHGGRPAPAARPTTVQTSRPSLTAGPSRGRKPGQRLARSLVLNPSRRRLRVTLHACAHVCRACVRAGGRQARRRPVPGKRTHPSGSCLRLRCLRRRGLARGAKLMRS